MANSAYATVVLITARENWLSVILRTWRSESPVSALRILTFP